MRLHNAYGSSALTLPVYLAPTFRILIHHIYQNKIKVTIEQREVARESPPLSIL